jgi:TP53 regulating kinase-like protein
MEWIDGHTVRSILGDSEDSDEIPEGGTNPFDQYGITRGERYGFSLMFLLKEQLEQLMILIGKALGRMHQADIIHSDLTTSNMMLHVENDRTELVESIYSGWSIILSNNSSGPDRLWSLIPVCPSRRQSRRSLCS